MSRHSSAYPIILIAVLGLAVAIVLGSLPATARSGDPLVLGEINRSGRSTWLTSKGPSTLKLNNTAGNPALDLRVEPGAPPLAVDSDALVGGLNADALDGYHAADLVMVDGCGRGPGDLVGINEWSCSMTLVTSVPGRIAMNGSADLIRQAVGGDYLVCEFQIGGVTARWSKRGIIVGDQADSSHQNNCSTSTMVEVPAGTHTISFHLFGMTTDTTLRSAAANVIFSPFGG